MKKTIRDRINIRSASLWSSYLITYKQWNRLCSLYDYRCACCLIKSHPLSLTVDHVRPVSIHDKFQRLLTMIEDIQPLCRSCNSSKNDQFIDYRIDFRLRLDYKKEINGDQLDIRIPCRLRDEQAAGLINVSVYFLRDLFRSGAMPYTQIGERYYVLFIDLMNYKKNLSAEEISLQSMRSTLARMRRQDCTAQKVSRVADAIKSNDCIKWN